MTLDPERRTDRALAAASASLAGFQVDFAAFVQFVKPSASTGDGPITGYIYEATAAIGTLLPPGRPGVVQGTVLVIATLFVLVNLLVDLLYRVLDPRTRAA